MTTTSGNSWSTWILPSLKKAWQQLPLVMSLLRGFVIAVILGSWLLGEVLPPISSLREKMDPAAIWILFAHVSIDLLITYFVYLFATGRLLDHQNQRPLRSLNQILKDYGKDTAAEMLRASALTLLWSLLFIIPGIFKYLRWSFVPFVVIANPRYAKGEIDALSESNRLIKGRTFSFLLVSLAIVAIQFGISSVNEMAMNVPVAVASTWRLGCSVLEMTFFVYSTLILYALYELRVKQGE